jgi:hypothetical protein
LTGGDAPRATLTDADKKAIAELESGQAQRKEIATANRIGKLKAKKSGATSAMPLTGKAALSAIAQSATKEFVANGGTITKCDDQPSKTGVTKKMSAKSKKNAKTAKAPKAKAKRDTSKRDSMVETIVAAMQKNGGVTNADQMKLLGGKRLNVGVLKDACAARKLKFSIVEKDGFKHYCAK